MMKKIREIVVFLIAFIFVFFPSLFVVNVASAQPAFDTTKTPAFDTSKNNNSTNNAKGTQESIELKSPFQFNSVQGFVDKILDILIKVGGVLAFFFIIFAGFKFVTAGGDPGAIKTAKEILLWTVIGVTIVLGAKAISSLVAGTVTDITGTSAVIR